MIFNVSTYRSYRNKEVVTHRKIETRGCVYIVLVEVWMHPTEVVRQEKKLSFDDGNSFRKFSFIILSYLYLLTPVLQDHNRKEGELVRRRMVLKGSCIIYKQSDRCARVAVSCGIGPAFSMLRHRCSLFARWRWNNDSSVAPPRRASTLFDF